jgi:hypothetical protein
MHPPKSGKRQAGMNQAGVLLGVGYIISAPVIIRKHKRNGCSKCSGRETTDIMDDNDAIDHLYPRTANTVERTLKSIHGVK